MAYNKKKEVKMEQPQSTTEEVKQTIVKEPSLSSEKLEDEKIAKETAIKLKSKGLVRIKIPVDPLNPKDLIVPVKINGYKWLIKRGETVEVPENVVKILERAKYI